jgi:hypothetical protein
MNDIDSELEYYTNNHAKIVNEIINYDINNIKTICNYILYSSDYLQYVSNELMSHLLQSNPLLIQFVSSPKPELLLYLVSKYSLVLKYIPEEHQTFEICRTAVLKSYSAIPYIKIYAPYLLLEVVTIYESALKYIEPQTDHLCLKAVTYYGSAIQYVKPEHMTNELLKAALFRYGEGLKFVPPEKQTEELCCIAIRQNVHAYKFVANKSSKIRELVLSIYVYYIVDMINEGIASYRDLYFALNKDGIYLKYIENQTKELAITAIQNCPKALKYVSLSLNPSDLNDVRLFAMRTNGLCLQFIPHPDQTYMTCHAAINNNGMAIEFMNPDILNADLLRNMAVKKNGLCLNYIGDEYKSYGICSEAIKNNGLALAYIPECFKSSIELCLMAVTNNGYAAQYIIDEYFNDDVLNHLYKVALKNNYRALKFIGNKIDLNDTSYDELLMEIVIRDGMLVEHINMKTEIICIAATSQNPLAIKFIGKEFQTDQLCKLVINKDPSMLRYIVEQKPEYCHLAMEIGKNLDIFKLINMDQIKVEFMCKNGDLVVNFHKV